MNAYSGFADVYDLLMDDFDYPAWADYYCRLMEEIRPQNICDCACGTGSMSVEFAKRGLRVTGVDISREMLENAGEKARRAGVQIQYACQDMCRLQLPRPVDALVCACDGVNYLTTDKRLTAFFAAAHSAIRPGGMLAFDFSTRYKLVETMGNAFFGEERDEAAYLWQNSVEDDIVTMDITFFLLEDEEEGLYRRVTERHRQKGHDPEHLKALLEEAGFRDVRIFGDKTMEVPGERELRVHISALRE